MDPFRTALTLATITLAALADLPLAAETAPAGPPLGSAASPAALPDAAGAPAALPSASPTPPDTPGDTRAVGGIPDAGSLPLTRNVVSNASFTASNATDGSDALKGVAGVASANSEGAENSSITIRGVKLDLFASYRLNGGLPIAGVINTPAEDKQRVEALKGANALMFGVSSPGGVVNVVTKRPTLDFAEVSVSGNSFGQIGAALDVSRLVGNEDHALGVRVNLSSVEVENGISDGGGHANFASVAVDWQVVRRVKVEFDYEGYRRDVVEQANITPLSPVNGFVPVPRVPDPTRLASGPWDVYTPRTQNYDLRTRVELSRDWHLLLEAGRSKSKRSRIQSRIINYNISSGEGTENTVYLHDQAYTNTFLRTELKGRFDTGFLEHDLTLGVSSSERYYNGAGTFTAPSLPQNIYAPVALPAPPPLTLAQLAKQTFAPQDPRDIGVYGYDTVTVFPKLKLLLGIRQVTDEQNDANTLGVHVKSTSTVYTPAAGLLYDVLPKTTVYASYMKGLVEGTQAPQQAVNSFQILGATLASQEEVGVRSTFFPGFSGSVAYFHLNVANSNLNETTNVFQYDGVTIYSGVETTLHEAFNRWWSLDASGLVLSAIEQPVIDLTLKGLTPENTAKVSGHIELTHRYAWLTGFTTSVGASYLGRRYVNSNDQGAVPGFALFNAGAGYVCHIWKRRTAFQLTVQNALDKSYWNSATSTAYGTGMVRSLRFNVRFDF